MPDDDTLNAQVKDSVQYANHTVMGHAASHSTSMLDALMAETIGMAMYNAVNTQHNSQMISSAAVTAACARMLKVQPIPWLPPTPAPVNPTITGVAPVAGHANTFTVSGSGFLPGLSMDVYNGATLLGTVTGSAITTIKPAAFTMQTTLLTPGATFGIQVINTDQGRSAPFSYTVPAPPANPMISAVAPVQGQANTFTVTGSNFATGESIEIFDNSTKVGTVSGSAITSVQPTSFNMQTALLTPGATFSLQVVDPKTGRSPSFPYTVPAS